MIDYSGSVRNLLAVGNRGAESTYMRVRQFGEIFFGFLKIFATIVERNFSLVREIF